MGGICKKSYRRPTDTPSCLQKAEVNTNTAAEPQRPGPRAAQAATTDFCLTRAPCALTKDATELS